MQTSLDGFIEGRNGEMPWVMVEDEETWRELNNTLSSVDTIILGRKMYPAYEQYWLALLDKPTGTKNENAYARRADKIEHLVLSKTLQKVRWKITRIIHDVEEIQKLRKEKGKDMLSFGGATLVSSLINLVLVDELHLMVNPLILGGGKALFKDVKDRHSLKLIQAKSLKSGKVSLIYEPQPHQS